MSISLESLVPDPSGARKASVGRQLLAFLLVGGSGAVAFIVLSTIVVGLHFGVPNWVASTLCYAALIGPVYLAHRRFSFRSDAPHAKALPRYVGVQLCGLALAAIFSAIAYSVLMLPALWASVLVTGLVSGINFVVLKLWAFAHSPAPTISAAPSPSPDISS
jgi:putative flippase GtrA